MTRAAISPEGRRAKALVSVLLSTLVIAACADAGPKTAIGAAAGGGSEGIIGGALLGGLLGVAIGNALDQRDREYAAGTYRQSLEMSRTGTTSTWYNPDSGHSGTITPTRTYESASGQYCREFQQTVTVGGQTEQAYGTACRQPDGSWQIVR
jgi:surface antigen